MKLIKLLPLLALLTLGCYETTAMPESLTADNFYIGTFTFTDFEDKSIPDFTLTITKNNIKIEDNQGVVFYDGNNNISETLEKGITTFKNSKNFRIYVMDNTFYPSGNLKYNFEFEISASDNGFNVHLYLVQYNDSKEANTEKEQVILFSNYDSNVGNEFDWLENYYSNTFIWNGKKYKSVSK